MPPKRSSLSQQRVTKAVRAHPSEVRGRTRPYLPLWGRCPLPSANGLPLIRRLRRLRPHDSDSAEVVENAREKKPRAAETSNRDRMLFRLLLMPTERGIESSAEPTPVGLRQNRVGFAHSTCGVGRLERRLHCRSPPALSPTRRLDQWRGARPKSGRRLLLVVP